MPSLLRACLVGAAVALSGSYASAQTPASDLVERGRYIATLADCVACHTAPGGAKFAGGYAVRSPLGVIWSTNITPSKRYGIGDYSEADFSRAVRGGVAKDGRHLYPAMPYDSYAAITDDDMKALYAFFMKGVDAVDQPAKAETSLAFPFNLRFLMAGWNLLYVGGPLKADPALGAAEARGRYVVDALAHCGACHTPRNLLMGADQGQYLAGGDVGPWRAPNITADPVVGVGAWSTEQLAAYLKSGHVNGVGQAAGPMAEAVQDSLQYASDADLSAVAAYLKSVKPAATASGATAATSFGAPKSAEAAIRGMHSQTSNAGLKSDEELYSGHCASWTPPITAF